MLEQGEAFGIQVLEARRGGVSRWLVEMRSSLGRGLEGAAWPGYLRFKIAHPAAVSPLASEHGGGDLALRVELSTTLSKPLPTLHVTGPLLQNLGPRKLGHPRTPRKEWVWAR